MLRAILCLCGLIASQAVAQSSSSLLLDKTGEYPVGFKPLLIQGSVTATNGGGPIQIKFWANVFYPARKASSHTTLAEIVRRLCRSTEDGDSKARERCQRDLFADSGVDQAYKAGVLNAKITAAYDAKPEGGLFPVVLFDGGLTSEAFNYVSLQQFLASHGYISISIPSRAPRGTPKLAFDAAAIEIKTANLELAIKAAKSLRGADANQIAAAAWSVGGVSATLLQMGHNNVRALLSIDGGMGYDYGLPLAKKSSRFSLNAVTVPILHLTGTKPNRFPVAKDLSFFEQAPSPAKFLAQVDGLNHGEFTFQGGEIMNATVNKATSPFWHARAASWQVVLLFLDAFVKKEPEAITGWNAAFNQGSIPGVSLRALGDSVQNKK